MIRVKVTNTYPDWPLLRQTPGSEGVWGNCRFFVNKDIRQCDYWVVCDGLLDVERVLCPPSNTIFIASEPPTIKTYDSSFLSQFAMVITCDPYTRHANAIHNQQALPWHVGRRVKNGVNVEFSKDYDELTDLDGKIPKDRLISVISSNLTISEGHIRRQRFTAMLKDYFGDRIDVFGRGIRDIEDKWDAIATYKYHVVIENSSFPDYWTEKLTDCFLGGAYPFYYGCPNLSDYFSDRTYTPIDIYDFDKSIAIMEHAMADQKYESSFPQRAEARSLVLERYNLFPMLSELCVARELDRSATTVRLKPQELPSTKTPIFNQLRRAKASFLYRIR